MKWPFNDRRRNRLILKCPFCANTLQFKAVPIGTEEIWRCETCSNSSLLLLVQPEIKRRLNVEAGKTLFH